MRGIYFDLIGGASGDMLVSALINLGCPLRYLESELKKMRVKFTIKKSRVEMGHIKIWKVKFASSRKTSFSYEEVKTFVSESKFREELKKKIYDFFHYLFAIEKKIHRIRTASFRFHHLGEIDAILEIASFWLAIEYFAINSLYVSAFPLAMMSPAALEILKGKKVRITDYNYESVTPTAALLLKDAEQRDFTFTFTKYAFSCGDFLPQDYLTVYLLEEQVLNHDKILKIETTIDDMNPQLFENLYEMLYKEGARDVYLETVLGKKSRPAFVLNILCSSSVFGKIRDLLFSATSTFGLRYIEFSRDKLDYKFIFKNTKFGKVRFRVSSLGKETPEYEDCLKIAKQLKIPLYQVYSQVIKNSR